MIVVMGCWMLAMVSGLTWARRWTGFFILMTAAAFVWMQHAMLLRGLGWLELAVLTATPWLLAAQRTRDERSLKLLHGEEAQEMARLSESARSLLSLQHATQQLEAKITQMTDVYHVTKSTARALHVSELFSACAEIAPRLLNAQGLRLIDLSNSTPQVLRAARQSDGRFRLPEVEPTAGSSWSNSTAAISPVSATVPALLPFESAIAQRAAMNTQAVSAAVQDLGCDVPDGLSRVAWAVLWREQKPIGVLVADELPQPQLHMLTLVANQLSLQLSRIRLYAQVEALAVTDALTGLFVRHHFLARAQEELARSARYGLSCVLLMMDLDLFKQKNDTYGHLVGDVVLRDVARLIQRHLRDIDLIARYGGEEFVLLLVDTTLAQAMPIAQRLRQLVEVHPIRAYDELLSQTISVGLAGFPDDARTLEELIERADQALYAAKRSGRNRVVRWSQHRP